MSKKKYLVLTGGGSGGHIAPLRALIPELKKDFSLLWVGSSHFEEGAADEFQIPFYKIQSGKLRRGKTFRNFLLNVRDFFRVVFAFFQVFFLFLKKRPQKIFSTGGFVSVPVVLAAGILRIPLYIHEQTIGFGLANKIALPFAKKIFLSFQNSKKYIPSLFHSKVIVSGNPIRKSLLGGSRTQLELFLGEKLEGKKVLYITGGGQGASKINEIIFSLLPEILPRYVVIHQVGKLDFQKAQDIKKKYNSLGKRNYFPFSFIQGELKHIYATANLVISRAGAGTVRELFFFNLPTIFIPLRPTQNDEQTKNAQWFLGKKNGILIHQEDLTAEKLLQSILLLEKENIEIKRKSYEDQKKELESQYLYILSFLKS